MILMWISLGAVTIMFLGIIVFIIRTRAHENSNKKTNDANKGIGVLQLSLAAASVLLCGVFSTIFAQGTDEMIFILTAYAIVIILPLCLPFIVVNIRAGVKNFLHTFFMNKKTVVIKFIYTLVLLLGLLAFILFFLIDMPIKSLQIIYLTALCALIGLSCVLFIFEMNHINKISSKNI